MNAADLHYLEAKPTNRLVLATGTAGPLVMQTTELSLPYLLAACHSNGFPPSAIVRARRPALEVSIVDRSVER